MRCASPLYGPPETEKLPLVPAKPSTCMFGVIAYFPPSLSEAPRNETGYAGVLASARFSAKSGTVPSGTVANVPMMASEVEDTGRLSMRAFHTLLSGNIGQPPKLLTFTKEFGFCRLALTHPKRPVPSLRQTLRRSGWPAAPVVTIMAPRCELSHAGSLPLWCVAITPPGAVTLCGASTVQARRQRSAPMAGRISAIMPCEFLNPLLTLPRTTCDNGRLGPLQRSRAVSPSDCFMGGGRRHGKPGDSRAGLQPGQEI